jgi:stage II sporulation protein E
MYIQSIIAIYYQKNGSVKMPVYSKAKEYLKTTIQKSDEIKDFCEIYSNKKAKNQKTDTKKREKSLFYEIIQCICLGCAGIILGLAPLPYKVFPLGTALALSVSGNKNTFFTFIGAMLSCVVYGDEAAAFFAVNVLCFFSRGFLTSFRFDESKKARFIISSLIGLLCAAIISSVGGLRPDFVFHGLSYAAGLIGGCTFFISVIPAERNENSAFFGGSLLAVSFIFIYALSKTPLKNFSPSIILAVFITLYCATRFSSMYGLVSGLVCGIAASSCTGCLYAMAAGCAGFAAGFFTEKKLLSAIISFEAVFSSILIYISGLKESEALISAAIATILFIPSSKVLPALRAKETFNITSGLSSSKRFEKLSSAFTSLSDVVYNISDKLKYPSEHEVRERIFPTINSFCRNCSMCEHCYCKSVCTQKDAEDIICDRLMSGGLAKKDLPEKYLDGCIKLPEIIEKLNEEYACLVRSHFNDNKTEILASEYNTMARLIKYTSQKSKTDKTPDKELSEKANAALSTIGVRFSTLEAYGTRMKTIDVHGVKLEKFPCTASELSEYLGEKCGCLFDEPEFIGIGENTTMRFVRKRKLSLEYARCAKAKGKSRINGDCVNFFESDDHYFYALISDGMGSGRSAALTSRLTSVFIEKLLTTGAHKNVTLEMLNNLLLSKNDESFATVDLLEIDLLSGEASFIKAGAAPAYILRASKLYKIASFTPPAGIIRSFSAENTKFTLEKGDTVLMLSDGIVQSYDEVPWLCEMLCADKDEDPARLSERILNKAKKINLRDDDMTCVAVKVL